MVATWAACAGANSLSGAYIEAQHTPQKPKLGRLVGPVQMHMPMRDHSALVQGRLPTRRLPACRWDPVTKCPPQHGDKIHDPQRHKGPPPPPRAGSWLVLRQYMGGGRTHRGPPTNPQARHAWGHPPPI